MTQAKDEEYVLHVSGGGKRDARSTPFMVGPGLIERKSLDAALRFMIDSRSTVGSHASAYGGAPWRDATYYTYEVPSLVMLYLANPGFFEQCPVEIDHERDAARVLASDFAFVRTTRDKDSLATARALYRDSSLWSKRRKPDLVSMLEWGVGMYLLDPETEDRSGGGLGSILHAETVEQFAFFLYAYPSMKRWLKESLYACARDFATSKWETVGLFKVIDKIGGPKGRDCPGHSILPNLMMYEVARRDGLAKPQRYLNAAIAQARWVVKTLAPSDPRVMKGQRMSEHKLISGLAILMRRYADQAPRGLRAWMETWADVAIERSANLWDYRKFDDENWSLPKPWNEPGTIAAFPGISRAVASLLAGDARKRDVVRRLEELAVSNYDNLFGRNPLGAASSANVAAYPGLDKPWPIQFRKDHCARLELCRGVLNSISATEHYPFTPQAGFRHCEGWTAFNAAFNVALAWSCHLKTRLDVEVSGDRAEISFETPHAGTRASLRLERGERASDLLLERSSATKWKGSFAIEGLKSFVLVYGHGYFEHRVRFGREAGGAWRRIDAR